MQGSANAAKFVPRQNLCEGERRVNFSQIDNDILTALTSEEALGVTLAMGHVYLCLANAPFKLFERPGVLRLHGETTADGEELTAWGQLLKLTKVSGATLKKALDWMREQGIIGYRAWKNGVGIRITLNRARASIAPARSPNEQKNLRLVRAANDGAPVSELEVPFNSNQEVQDKKINPPAPKNGAGERDQRDPLVHNKFGTAAEAPSADRQCDALSPENIIPHVAATTATALTQQIASLEARLSARLKNEMEPMVRSVAAKSLGQLTAQEFTRNREWFETKALPKAVRVAQHETFALLRKAGLAEATTPRNRAAEVGRNYPAGAAATARPIENRTRSEAQIVEIAESCLALLEIQGKPIERSLSEISTEAGGWLPSEDVARVRKEVLKLSVKCGN